MSSVLESLFFAVGEDGLSIEELESILEIDEKCIKESLKLILPKNKGIYMENPFGNSLRNPLIYNYCYFEEYPI